jgi:hypothetical protein
MHPWCAPGTFAKSAVIVLAVFNNAVAHKNAQYHQVAVSGPAGGLSKVARE